ncbi:MAG: carbohydrate binding family 9 domain-containing protein, partial [Calditrichia bacterium]|nr:carbohydrate binding family 9 domain-containing protein [Calditrichia bacterium]
MILKSNDRFFLLLAGLLCFLINELQAQSENPPKLLAIKAAVSPDLDGKLDESFWQDAALVKTFTQREPEEGVPVSESTFVYIYYDEDNIYFGFDCRDREAEKIIATEMRRDSYLLNNDCVEIYLDTYHDHRTAFYFSTNALGARRDGIIQAELNYDTQNWDWNGIWDVASQIDDRGWTAEVVIPFKTLRFTPGQNKTWGLNIARYIPRKR